MTDKEHLDNINDLFNRFENLLEVQKELQLERITATFTEYDIKKIIFALGLLKQMQES